MENEIREKGFSGFSGNQLKIFAIIAMTMDHLETYEAGGHIMTDDKAPVELLGMRMIDELIQNEVSYYKTIYQEKGIRGLIDLLS